MQNHTGTHLLNCALNKMFEFTRQKSRYEKTFKSLLVSLILNHFRSLVAPDEFKFDFVSLNAVVDNEAIFKIEEAVNGYINNGTDINREIIENPEWTMKDDSTLNDELKKRFKDKAVITMPEETYPEKVSVIEIEGKSHSIIFGLLLELIITFFHSFEDSVEPCCGTHVMNTADVQSFVILNVKSTHPGHKSLRCVTGNRAQMSREAGLQLISEVMDLYNLVNGKEINDVDLVRISTKCCKKFDFNLGLILLQALQFHSRLLPLKERVKKDKNDLPYTVKAEIKEILSELEQHVPKPPETTQDFEGQKCIVHAYETKVDANQVFKPIADKPFLILIPKKKNSYMCYANVPENHQNDNINAEAWIHSILPEHEIEPSGAFFRTKKPFEVKDVKEFLEKAKSFTQQME